MAGFGEPERARRHPVEAGGDPPQIQPGNADAAAGGVRVEPDAPAVGEEGPGDVDARDHLMGPVPATGREFLGRGHTGGVAQPVDLHVPVLGVRRSGLAVPEQHPDPVLGEGSQQRLVSVVAPGRHLTQHVLDLPGRRGA